MPYQYSPTIANLLLQQGNIRANTLYNEQAPWANAVASLGQTAASSIKDVMAYKDQELQRTKNQLEMDQLNRTAQAQKSERLLLDQWRDPQTGQINEPEFLNSLSSGGYPDRAAEWQTKFQQQHDTTTKASLDRIAAAKGYFAQGAQIVAEAKDAYPKDPTSWQRVYRPQLFQLAQSAGIDDKTFTDQVPDQYDPAKITALINNINATREAFDKQENIYQGITRSRGRATDAVTAQQGFEKATNEAFSHAQTQEQWDIQKDHLVKTGVPPDVVKAAGDFDNGAGPKRANEALLAPADRQKAIDRQYQPGMEGLLATFVNEKGRQPTAEERLDLTKKLNEATQNKPLTGYDSALATAVAAFKRTTGRDPSLDEYFNLAHKTTLAITPPAKTAVPKVSFTRSSTDVRNKARDVLSKAGLESGDRAVEVFLTSDQNYDKVVEIMKKEQAQQAQAAAGAQGLP